ncbi:MAG: hypothetical protein ACNI26_08280 [Terasakiella sp.]|uniref:TipJ family phage tail tip protein n=1 Tax=unclassified Terasakiella TaxID=2614952 RepID=UPI003AFFCB8B
MPPCIDLVPVKTVYNPLTDDRETKLFKSGAKISEIVEWALPDENDLALAEAGHASVYVGGVPIPQDYWHRVKVKQTTQVDIVFHMQGGGGGGGGKNVLGTVIMIAAIAVGGYLAANYAASLAFSMGVPVTGIGGVSALAIGKAVIMGGTMLVGSMLSSMIAPAPSVPTPNLASMGFGSNAGMAETTLHSITGTKNQLNPDGIIPKLFGRRKVYPPLAMTPRTRLNGDDELFIQTFAMEGRVSVLSEGEASGFYIGDTPLELYDGVRFELREGLDSDTDLTMVQDTVRQDILSITLSPDDAWTERVVNGYVDAISIDVVCPRGCYYLLDKGDPVGEGVLVEVQYSPINADDWQDAVWHTGWTHTKFNGRLMVTSSKIGPARRGGTFSVPYGEYKIRFRRPKTVYFDNAGYAEINPDMYDTGWPYSPSSHWHGNSPYGGNGGRADSGRPLMLSSDPNAGPEYTYSNRSINEIQVSALRAIENADPIKDMPGLFKLALEIKASGQLNGVVDELWFVGQSWLPVWDGAQIIYQQTRHPAWAVLSVMIERQNAAAVPLERVDLDALKQWADTDPNRTFDAVVDSDTTVENLIREICASGRASPHHDGQKYTVLVDRPQSVRAQLFSPRNSWGFQGTKIFAEPPHALRVPFVNADEGYKDDEIIVYDAGYNKDTATIIEALPMIGHTGADQITYDGKFHLSQARLRGMEDAVLYTDFQALSCRRGSRVGVNHDVPRWGLGSGRILSNEVDGNGKCIAVICDETFPMEGGKTYQCIIRLADDRHLESDVVTVIGGTNRLEFTTPQDLVPEREDFVTFGGYQAVVADFIVTGIGWDKEMNARLDLKPYAPEVYNVDQETIPPHETTVNADPNTTPPAPTVTLEQSTKWTGDFYEFNVEASWTMPEGSRAAGFEIWRTVGGQDELYFVTAGGSEGSYTFKGIPAGQSVWTKVVAVSATGRKLPLATLTGSRLTVIDDAPNPPNVENFLITRLSDGLRRVSWSLDNWTPPVTKGGGLKIRIATDPTAAWENMTPLHEGVLTASPYDVRFDQTGEILLAARLQDLDGRLSDTPAYITATIDDPRNRTHLASSFEHELNWSGTITDGYKIDGLLRAVSNGGWDSLPDTWDDLPDTWSTILPAKTLVYETDWMDVGRVLRFTPTINTQGKGVFSTEVAVANEVTWDDLPNTWSALGGSWADILGDAVYAPIAGAVQGRFFKVRVSVSGATPELSALTVHADAIVETEFFEDLDPATENRWWFERIATGHFRVATLGGIGLLTTPSIRAIQGAGQGWTSRLISKNTTVSGKPAAEFQIYDATGTLADAVVDIELKGVAI